MTVTGCHRGSLSMTVTENNSGTDIWAQGLFSMSEVRIERGFYCCYDPLARLDVRCELCIPGGVVCGALDCEGNVHDVTPELWRNCVVASFLRAELYDAELVSYSSVPVARYPPLPNPSDEVRLLEAVTGLYEDMVLPEALEALTVDQSGGVAPEHADVVLHTLLHYFSKRQCWNTALQFFARLARIYPTAALYVAAVQRECGFYNQALATLTRAVEEVPDDPVLLVGLATEYLYADKVDAALRLATKSAHLRPQLRPAWLVLSRAHVRRGAGAAALVVLNLVPPPPLPGKEDSMLHVVVPPDPKSVTKPAVRPYDLDVIAVRQVLAEEAFVNSTGSAASGAPDGPSAALPGSLLLPREPPNAGVAPDTAPIRITKAVLEAVYTVLQELVAVMGWDGFLRLRSSVFMMHADSDILREQQREAEERELQLQLLHRQLSATLPPSPNWALPQAPLDVAPQELEAGLRGPPEGVDFGAALDEAAMMGLAEYPEHLQNIYDDPRAAAARGVHRRHLREIAERQARLEAADGGAYADDEWDGSSDGSAAGRPGKGVGRGSGGGAGGPRSLTGRPQRGRHKVRRSSGGKHQRTSHTVPMSSGRQQPEQQLQGAAEEEHIESGEHGRPDSSTTAVVEDKTSLGTGIVDAGEVVRQETAKALLQTQLHALKDVAKAPSVLPEQDLKQPQKQAMAETRDRDSGAPPETSNAITISAAAPTSWWSALFGGGGGGGGGAIPQRREAGPLGEAVEWQTVGDRSKHGIAKATCTKAAGPPCTGCSPLLCSASVGSLSGGAGLDGGCTVPPANRRSAWLYGEACLRGSGANGRPAAVGSSGRRWDPVKAVQRCARLSWPQKLAAPYGPRAPLLTAPCWSREVSATVGCIKLSGSIMERRSIQRGIRRHGWGPGPVAESGADAAVFSTTQPLEQSATDAPPQSPRGIPAASTLSAFGKAAVNTSAVASVAADRGPTAGRETAAVDTGDDGCPLVLHNHDADRQMVLRGLDVMELGAKRLCVRWLDELIVALWHDLQAFLDWKAFDLELAEAGFQTHAEIIGGMAPAPTAADYQRQAGPAASTTGLAAARGAEGPNLTPPPPPRPPPHLPSLPCTEWLRRGLLAERLHHEADALAAYQAAVRTPPQAAVAVGSGGVAGSAIFAALHGGGPGAFSMIAWQAIMRLAPVAEPRDVSWALQGAQAVMTWLETHGDWGVMPSAGAAMLPFTTGFVGVMTTATAGGAGAAAAGRAAPATAAAPAAGAKLQACPLSVVHCLHLVAAVIGDSGVEETLTSQSGSPSIAGTSGEAVMAKGGGVGVSGAAAAAPTHLHPAAATVIRHAVRAAASQSELDKRPLVPAL
ncbi:hypothetical protein Vretimale_16377 [Volvox reticuliferus]|uniref:Uncharacterized protein n=1 Tax=Volvox reticuliferus TaxID=1737510 RepID=A0A8J4GSY0_9CHLO|nr:hypothetical protein Vretimale_16377 [Volvox reticuliferus]